MASFVISKNVVANEKFDTMKNFKKSITFCKFLPAIEAFAVVLLILSWFTPPFSAVKYLERVIPGGFTGGIFLFGVVNVLIALIFSLSNNNHKNLNEHDIYSQYVSSSSSTATATHTRGFCSSSSSTIVSKDNEEKTSTSVCKTVITDRFPTDMSSSNFLFSCSGKQRPDFTSVVLTTGESRTVRKEMVRAVSPVGETANSTIRMKSEMTFLPSTTSTRTSSVNDHHVYSRSRSERLDVSGDFRMSMRRLCEMDDLSNDEFRSKVETFIARKKKMLSTQ
ncbi:unnamed protein product [Cochlearia groenlandica]